jgi:ATP-dependent DNA ligase
MGRKGITLNTRETYSESLQLPKERLDFIKPMLAKSAAQPPAGLYWLYKLKLAGYRTLAGKQRNLTLFSRRGS